ncbi:MAG: methionyl-tRNA formyltransferase [Deltaproteobacteria bacterium]|jgi:methionyl-tRNA formyltransferase|nr:methionyl-tRNA formyltransferase [Deltaproteobacteria bacterium]
MAAPQNPLAIVFMGTPPFAARVLERLLAWEGCLVRGVWCQPDRPAGRGHKLTPPAVKLLAQQYGLPVRQPEHFKAAEHRAELAACKPDVLVVAAYGRILPQELLDIPRLAPVNVHASLLPGYRGAAPVQRAIMDGCERTGVTIMHMDAGLDTGPVYAMRAMEIGEHTGGSLHEALAGLGGELLVEVLADLAGGRARAVPQPGIGVSYAPKVCKADGRINWNAPVRAVHAQVRAVTPWPGACAVLYLPPRAAGGTARELPVTFAPGTPGGRRPAGVPAGSLWLGADGVLSLVCQDGLYGVGGLRPADRAFMSARDFLHGFLAPGASGVCGRAVSEQQPCPCPCLP